MLIASTITAARNPDQPTQRALLHQPDEDHLLAVLTSARGEGEPAAETARTLATLALESLQQLDPRKHRKPKSWQRLVRDLDAELARRLPENTTASLLAIAVDAATVHAAAVGACALWILGRGADHDLTAEQPASPLLGAAQSPAALCIASTIPGPRDIDHDVKHGGGALLAMTPGLHRHVDRAHLIDAALRNQPEPATHRLEELARWRNNGALTEDFAALIIRR
ncbi:MAG: hypothetical protein VYC34_07955 [Planctomycetota bacterium]|nr:hypothetical protein [Planctomycetota bacterium]